jgi:hypothetical protein
MENRINKTSICCIVFLDIIDYSKKTGAEQIEVKNEFNRLISLSLNDIAQNDRIILDTGDGAAITYMGSPEDALFMAMSIHDGIKKNNLTDAAPLFVRFGINLGPVRVVNDINGQLNVIGDGINVAQRIMSFAKPNEILVSRSYFELTSRLTDELSKLFDYSGVYQDKHVREHEVYTVKSVAERAIDDQPSALTDNVYSSIPRSFLQKNNWRYVLPIAMILLAFILLVSLILTPSEPVIKLGPQVKDEKLAPAEVKSNYLTPSESVVDVATVQPQSKSGKEVLVKDTLSDTQLKGVKDYSTKKQDFRDTAVSTKPAQKDIKVKSASPEQKGEVTIEHSARPVVTIKPAKPLTKTENPPVKEEIKKSSELNCNQAQMMMNQCR